METSFSFICSCCGERHDGLPDIFYDRPWYWNATEAAADSERNRLGSDLCIVGGEHFFIRCVLFLPIKGTSRALGWGVWVSQSKANFDLYAETYDATPERATFGYLANRLATYPDTLNLNTQAHWQSNGKRPWVELAPCDHPLYRDWSEGITREQAVAFAERALHPAN